METTRISETKSPMSPIQRRGVLCPDFHRRLRELSVRRENEQARLQPTDDVGVVAEEPSKAARVRDLSADGG